MNIRFIVADFTASMRHLLRSKSALFFTMAFPVILILLFGAIFSGGGSGTYALYVTNYDYENGDVNQSEFLRSFPQSFMGNESNVYDALYNAMESTGVIDIKVVNASEYKNNSELLEFLKEKKIKSMMVVPNGYLAKVGMAIFMNNESIAPNITLYLDQSEAQRNGAIISVVSQFFGQINLAISGGKNYLRFNTTSIIQEEFSYIDFFIPGIVSLIIMTSSVFGTIESNVRLRKNGILRKLITTPVGKHEWIVAKMLYMLFMSFLSTIIILSVGMLVWNISFIMNIYVPIVIISASFAFSGMGMIVARYVKDEDTASAAGNIITFPQMFLAGTFFPMEIMPSFLVTIAKALPLYYVNEGLRNAMIYGDLSAAFVDSLIILVFAAIVFAIGVAVTSWREE